MGSAIGRSIEAKREMGLETYGFKTMRNLYD